MLFWRTNNSAPGELLDNLGTGGLAVRLDETANVELSEPGYKLKLAWWWIVSVMTAFLLSFLAESETVRGLTQLSKRYLLSTRAG